jgi:hypothetical protein
MEILLRIQIGKTGLTSEIKGAIDAPAINILQMFNT